MANTYLTRTPSSTGNRRKFTFSFWIKRSKITANNTIYNVRPDSNGANRISFHSTTDTFRIAFEPISKALYTNRKFTDTNAWYHIVIAVDTEQGTASDRVKLYVNGVQETSFSTADYPDQDTDLDINTQNIINIGRDLETSSDFTDGYISHFHFCDGQQLAPTVFGSTDTTTGEWQINASPTFTPGTNGFTILKDGNTITDQSTNSNDFSLGGGTLTKTEDCPSNVFATFNPLDNYHPAMTLSYGNTRALTIANKYTYTPTTLGMTSGKYYAEIKCTAQSASQDAMVIGITSTSSNSTTQELGHNAHDWGYYADTGQYRNNDSSTNYGAVWTTGAIICIAVDLDNNKLYFRRDGNAWENSGDPTSGSTGTGAISITDPASTPRGAYFFTVNNWSSTTTATFDANFGNGYFGTTAVSSAGANASGNGIFEYDIPTGYTALSTKGLNL